MKRSNSFILIGLLLVLTLAAGYALGLRQGSGEPATSAAAEHESERKPLYWYDPMVPDQHFDAPGKSPFMDMMLVPRYADEGGDAEVVRIAPGLRQNLGIRTARVELDVVGDTIRVPGTLQWDLRAEQRISARVEGLIETVHVRAPFTEVRRGQPLVTLLAPALSSALAEYRALASSQSADARELQAAARTRLALLGLSERDLPALGAEGTPRIVLRSPNDGVLTEIMAREGDTVMPGALLFRLNAPDPIWLETQVPQANTQTLSAGSEVEALVSAIPGVRFAGEVEAVLPDIDPATRTQTVRIVLPNPDHSLAAGMFAEALLRGDETRRCPWVPSDALILTGRDARVIVQEAEGRFRPVAVVTGRQVGERTEILDGLSGGELVVVSGQFLIDSEASLSGALSRLQAPSSDNDSDNETDDAP